MNKLLTFLLLFIVTVDVMAQGSFIPMGNETYHSLDRLEVKTGLNAPFHAAIKGWNRSDATAFALMLDTAQVKLSSKDKGDLNYIFLDNSEWLGIGRYTPMPQGRRGSSNQSDQTQLEAALGDPRFAVSKRPILKYFYQTPANLFDVNDKHFHIRVNPLLDINASKSGDDLFFMNLRGLQVRGGLDDRIYFFMNIIETQAGFPEYVNDRYNKYNYIPGNGFVKPYNSNFFNIENGYDYLNGQGYLGYNITRHVGMQFGYGRHFIGNGYRSMLLSDFSNNFLFLKINWKVWKFHYQNIFAELTTGTDKSVSGGTLIPKKYMAAHYLSFKLLPNLELGFFETVMFSRDNHFELQYLNPVIFYRLVEHSLGSPDNVLIGINAKWNFLKRFQMYGQLMLDEFKFKELFVERNGWWANKYGIQLGLKYYDVFGVDHFDLQFEYNSAQPFTYTFRDESGPYAHFDQPLAHPLGANFRELILLGRYRLNSRWLFEGRLIAATFGEDPEGENWGGDILLSYLDRIQDYGNAIGQGISANTLLAGMDVSYMVRHNIFLDAKVFYRNKDSEMDSRDQNLMYFGAGLRMNIAKNRMDF